MLFTRRCEAAQTLRPPRRTKGGKLLTSSFGPFPSPLANHVFPEIFVNPYFYEYLCASKCATVACFHMTTRNSLTEAALALGRYSPVSLATCHSPLVTAFLAATLPNSKFHGSHSQQTTSHFSSRNKNGTSRFHRPNSSPPLRAFHFPDPNRPSRRLETHLNSFLPTPARILIDPKTGFHSALRLVTASGRRLLPVKSGAGLPRKERHGWSEEKRRNIRRSY
jgi:hypothetical protein